MCMHNFLIGVQLQLQIKEGPGSGNHDISWHNARITVGDGCLLQGWLSCHAENSHSGHIWTWQHACETYHRQVLRGSSVLKLFCIG